MPRCALASMLCLVCLATAGCPRKQESIVVPLDPRHEPESIVIERPNGDREYYQIGTRYRWEDLNDRLASKIPNPVERADVVLLGGRSIAVTALQVREDSLWLMAASGFQVEPRSAIEQIVLRDRFTGWERLGVIGRFVGSSVSIALLVGKIHDADDALDRVAWGAGIGLPLGLFFGTLDKDRERVFIGGWRP